MDKPDNSRNLHKALSMSGRFVYYMYQLVWSSLDMIYPPHCGGCNRRGVRWCQDCNSDTQLINEPYCPICGIKLFSPHVCLQCNKQRPKFEQLRSWSVFDGALRNAIHKLKYKRDISLAEVLSRPLVDIIANHGWVLDMVVPVPLSRNRLNSRGYNQAALLAFPIAISLDIKYYSKAVKRIRDTRSQVGLSQHQRYENLHGAFMANKQAVYEKTILIVDDVVTSGATINACANALMNSGAKCVYAITLARAMHN